jgi:hypothetical protein
MVHLKWREGCNNGWLTFLRVKSSLFY